MSRRQFLNVSIASTTFLLLVALGAVLTDLGGPENNSTQIELAHDQSALVDDLNRQAAQLEAAEDFATVQGARRELARSILRFDSTLSALVHGGALVDDTGGRREVGGVKNGTALTNLQNAAELWTEIGLPLSDLAAGEFSIFSVSGQQAVAGLRTGSTELAQYMDATADALVADSRSGGALATGAKGMALLLAGALVAFGVLRSRLDRSAADPRRPAPRAPSADDVTAENAVAARPATAGDEPLSAPVRAGHSTVSGGSYEGFTSPVDFDNVNASVDQMSVDMNTIAGSTEKMRLAIDSVGHALQGMLYSLNEMAQDTAEGHKVVRGANNAASYTATAAEDLASSAREMARVVARVTQLAVKTKQVASQIDAEAVHTGQTGEAFTSVVAAEVQGLAGQTSRATHEIESTVAEILATARQYEEAIGQIIKNISAINKVSQNLGQLMLHPPQTVVPGTPLAPAAPQMMAAPAPVPAPAAPVAAAATEPVVEPVPTPVAEAEPDAAEAEEPVDETPDPETASESAPEPEASADPWGGIIDDDPVEPEPTPDEVAEETSAAIEDSVEVAEEEEAPPSDGSNANVFMLGGPRKKKASLPTPEPEPVEEAAPEAVAPAEPEPEPVAAAPEPEPEPEPKAEPKTVETSETSDEEEEKPSSNIFMLNKKK